VSVVSRCVDGNAMGNDGTRDGTACADVLAFQQLEYGIGTMAESLLKPKLKP